MATNWPPASFPAWPPVELETNYLSFSSIRVGIASLIAEGFTWANPTAQENNDYFRQVRCDEGHPCQGIMIISPLGVRYPFAYCTGATHKSALVLWEVGRTSANEPVYDLGWDSGAV